VTTKVKTFPITAPRSMLRLSRGNWLVVLALTLLGVLILSLFLGRYPQPGLLSLEQLVPG
jgi:hypothetical protein